MTPRRGQMYSRRDINKMFGGQLQHYVPHKDGQIVCGCFDPDPTLNPGAPEEVIFGSNPEVSRTAEMMSRQGHAVPVFLRRTVAQWEYIGDYKCVGYSTDPKLIRDKTRAYPAREGIAGVLYFQRT